MGTDSAIALGVGRMPSPPRSNNSSCKDSRRRRRIALIAGWLSPIFCPARVTLRSVIKASNATSRLRSKDARFMSAHILSGRNRVRQHWIICDLDSAYQTIELANNFETADNQFSTVGGRAQRRPVKARMPGRKVMLDR